jgi:DNA-binding SARP family transcriptional activator
MSQLALYLLGPPRLELDGEEIHISRRKAIALLTYLAVTGRSHSRDSVATLLWPELDQSTARARLRRALAALREALGDGWLEADRETLGLNPDADVWLDMDAFHDRLAACEAHGHPPTETCPDCLPLLEEAAALYRDHFLAGFTLRDSAAFDEFQFFQTEALKDRLADALRRLVRYHSDQEEHASAIEYARRWLALDPLHEPAHRHLMRLYAQSGQQSAALRQYRLCLRTLEEELGLPPSEETTALYERIRAERARPAEGEVTAPTPSHAPVPAFLAEEQAPAPVERPVFVARERELARLDGYLQAALDGQGQVAFVTGGPGRGKTALMHEFARRALEAHPDLLVAHGNCNAYSGVGDPYLPFREVLGMLTGDVEGRWAAGAISGDHARRLWAALPPALRALVAHGPSLIGTVVPGAGLLSRAVAVVPQDTAWLEELRTLTERERPGHTGLEQSAIFQQITNVLRALAQAHPLLLLLDDVQWADAGSIGLLFHLGRRLEGGRILIACAYRPEEITLGRAGEPHPLEKVLAELQRTFGDVWGDLARADAAQGRGFVDALLDTEPHRLGDDFRDKLFGRTGGQPLFTVELLRAMQERGDLIQDETGQWIEGPALDWERLPARVEAVITARVDRLDDALRDFLTVASVEGERFTAQVIARVQGLSEREMLRALSWELGTRHRLVREGEEVQVDGRFLSRYQFAHALFQEHLYRGLGAGERRLLHGEVAAALEALYGDQADQIAGQLAHHFDETGQVEKAVRYSLRAGDQARVAYADEEAIAYLRRALELLDESALGESRKDWRLKALRGLGQMYSRTREFAAAEEYLQEAITLGQKMGITSRELVRLYHWLGEVLHYQGRYDDRIRLGEQGLTLVGEDTESVEAALMNQLIAAGYRAKGGWERWEEITYRTAQFIQRLPYVEELGPAYMHIVWAYREDKDVEEAMKWLRALEEKATQHRDFRALMEVHEYTAGIVAFLIGDLHGVISRCRQALELSTRIGDAYNEFLFLFYLGHFFLSLGEIQKAEEHAHRLLKVAEASAIAYRMAHSYWLIAQIALCRGDWERAVDASQRGIELFQEVGDPGNEAFLTHLLGRAFLARGDRARARTRFQHSVARGAAQSLSWWPLDLTYYLSGLEATYDDPTEFRTLCRRFREDYPELDDFHFTRRFSQWFLEPSAVGAVRPD